MSLTNIVLTACFIILGIYDFIVVARSGVQTSISRELQRIGFKSPVVCLVIGFLLGHWFGYMPPEPVQDETQPAIVVPADVDSDTVTP